jgi:site-specific DNA-methyltransferase (adenine-specific)
MSKVEHIAEGVTLYRADCMDVMPGLVGVSAIVTDPPYFLPAVHYNTRREFPRSLTDLSILEAYFFEFFAKAKTTVGGSGVAYVFCDGQSYPAFYATAYRHFKKLRPLVWDKVSAFNGYNWRHQHELILFLEASESEPVPTGDGDILRCPAVKIDDRDHPAEKPPNLIEMLVRKSVKEGAAVCDPFMGSAATGVACIQSGRGFIGIEREPAYFDIACRRLSEALKQQDLFVKKPPRAEQMTMLAPEPAE